MNTLPVYDVRYIKTKIWTHTLTFVPENNTECECFTVTAIDSLLVYENKYIICKCI